MLNGTGIEHWVNPGSASGPAADQNSNGAMTVGAIDPALGTTIANYSSEGPTNDSRIKPDISAAACVESQTFDPGCFNGTSAATPVVAGGAALVLGSGVATHPGAGAVMDPRQRDHRPGSRRAPTTSTAPASSSSPVLRRRHRSSGPTAGSGQAPPDR